MSLERSRYFSGLRGFQWGKRPLNMAASVQEFSSNIRLCADSQWQARTNVLLLKIEQLALDLETAPVTAQ